MLLLSCIVATGAGVIFNSALVAGGRSSYQILVLPHGEQLSSVVRGARFVDPDLASSSEDNHLTNSDVARITKTPGVEVAAPLGFVALTRQAISWPCTGVPLSAKAGNYEIAVKIQGTDGVQARTFQQYTASFSISTSSPPPSGDSDTSYISSPDRSVLPQYIAAGVAIICLRPMPDIASSVIAVDPVKEKELLGPGGKFLDPLIAYDELAAQTGPLTCSSVGCQGTKATLSNPELSQFRALSSGLKGQPSSVLNGIYGGTAKPFVPFLRNVNAYPQLTMTATFRDQLNGTQIGTTRLNLSSRLRPFADSNLSITWPGAPPLSIPAVAQTTEATKVSPLIANVTVNPSGKYFATAQSQGNIISSGQIIGKPGPSSLGGSATYRVTTAPVLLKVASLELPGFAPLDVGTFSSSALGLKTTAAGIPLGGYDPVAVTSKMGGATKTLGPLASGLGVSVSPAAAVMSIADAERTGAQDPIDLVRVRVTGARGTEAPSPSHIEATALRLSEEGYRVTVVTGASLQDLPMKVQDFVTTSKTQTLSYETLKASRPYLRLGVASQVDTTLSTLTDAGVALSASAAVGLTAVIGGATVPGRKGEAQILELAGLPRRRRFWWYLAEDSVPVALYITVLLSFAVFGVFASSTLIFAIATGAVVAVALVALVSAWFGSARPAAASRSRRHGRGARITPLRYALAELLRHPAEAAVWVLATSALLAAVTLLSALVPYLSRQASQTRLGAYAVQFSAVPLTLTIVVSGGCAVIAVLATSRAWRTRSREQERLLREECGWTSRLYATTSVMRIVILWALSTGVALGFLILLRSAESAISPSLEFFTAATAAVGFIAVFASARSALPGRGELGPRGRLLERGRSK